MTTKHWTQSLWIKVPTTIVYLIPVFVLEGLNLFWGSQMIQTLPGILSRKNIGLDAPSAVALEVAIIVIEFVLFMGNIQVIKHHSKFERILFRFVILVMIIMDVFSNIIPFAVGNVQTKYVLDALINVFVQAWNGDVASIVTIVISLAIAIAVNITPFAFAKAAVFMWVPESKHADVSDFTPVKSGWNFGSVMESVSSWLPNFSSSNTTVSSIPQPVEEKKYHPSVIQKILEGLPNFPVERIDATIEEIARMATLNDQDSALTAISEQYRSA